MVSGQKDLTANQNSKVCTGKKTNSARNQQDATTFSFINLFKSTLHVSDDKFAHSQEHFLTVYTAFWYNALILLPTGDTVEMEHATHTPFHDMLPHNRIINNDVISPNVLT